MPSPNVAIYLPDPLDTATNLYIDLTLNRLTQCCVQVELQRENRKKDPMGHEYFLNILKILDEKKL